MTVERTSGSAMLTLQLLRIQTPRTPVASVIATIDRVQPRPEPSSGASVPPLGQPPEPHSPSAPSAASAYAEF